MTILLIIKNNGLITPMVSTLLGMCQLGLHFKKNFNCVQTFEKMSQLSPFILKKIKNY